MKLTTLCKKNIIAFNSGVRRIVNMGGTSSSKSFSLLQLCWIISDKRKNKGGVSISVVSETLPHLKLGVIRDFEKILKENNLYDEKKINKTDHIYYFGDSYIEFFAADQGKATGPRRNILYLNECNNISYTIVSELEQRTDETIFYDFNPTAEFWIVDKVFALPSKEYVLIKSNYKDNEYLADSIKKEIELKASLNPNYKRIHIDVEFGNYEGLIFQNWKMVDADKMPPADKRAYGMDFGFTNDPTTLVDVRLFAGELWVDELLYERGLTPEAMESNIKELLNGDRSEIIADNEDPRMIDYLRRKGLNIKATIKGKDSVRTRIENAKQYPINITKRSVNLIKEMRAYMYKKDKFGSFINEPALGQQDHGIDSLTYASQVLIGNKNITSPKYHF